MGGVRIADTTGDATSKNRRLHIVGRSTAPASDFIDSIGQLLPVRGRPHHGRFTSSTGKSGAPGRRLSAQPL